MLDYYANQPLRRWIERIAARETLDLAFVVSTAMAPYAAGLATVPKILDMVDVDSRKWADYARRGHGIARLVWAREARTLLAYERRAARAYDRTLLVTEAESRYLADQVPDIRDRVVTLENGVDLDFFAPAGVPRPDPYPAGPPGEGPWLAMIGNLDYWPNADGAIWFARDVLPELRRRTPPPRLAIVGANPDRQVRGLAALPGVLVTGRVADVRPYLEHAAVVVAPLRVARGVQNKVLEGMAMARPVVATTEAFLGIRAEPGRDLLVAAGARDMARAVAAVLDGLHPSLGPAGRQAMEAGYSWPGQLARLDAVLAAFAPLGTIHAETIS
jgi:sugar transferase (PEP-CTERM/EpsH1 system associated)